MSLFTSALAIVGIISFFVLGAWILDTAIVAMVADAIEKAERRKGGEA